ncbi:MAG: arabinogalactan oligomer/maltooligosaccharide transport system permease protein [Myxococcota bacterium]|jgi:arabinogalactan oligomer/maltooligosaccharide transport system permease protein
MIWLLGALAGSADARELEVWHAYRGAERDAVEAVAASWGQANDVTVNCVALPFGAFDSKLETAVPRGNGPDLFIAAHGGLGKWVAMDVVAPLDSADLEPYRPVTRDAMQWKGLTYGLPLAFKSILLLYDPERVTTVPRTTDELIAAARKLTGDGGYGLAYQASEPYFHGAFMHAFGAWSIDPEGEVHLDTEAHAAAYAFTRRLSIDEGIAPTQPTGELMGRLYREGKAAFVISGPWFIADMDKPVAAAILPVVSETGEPARPYLTVDGVFLAAQASNPRDASLFAEHLAGRAGAELRQEVGRQAVAHAGVTSDDPLLATLAEQAAHAVPLPATPDIASVFEAQARSLRAVSRGATTPEAAADAAQTYYNILSRPPPPAVSPWPYIALVASVFLAVIGWLAWPLTDPLERRRIWRHRWDYTWVLPAGVAMSALVIVPFLTGASVAFFAHHQGEWTFVGLTNFADILLSRDWPLTSSLSFWYTLVVTVVWTITNLILHVGLGVALALVLREPWIRLRTVWRALLIIPWAVPNYITALIWKGMFHAQYGAVNALLGIVTLSDGPIELDWFGSFATAFCANLATNTWLGFPFMMVVTLGALQSIPRELEEAAEVDGAGWAFRFRHVVWPLLQPALLPAVILGSVWTFNMFNVIYLVSAGEPNSSTEILISEAYRWAFSRGNRYGYASAYAVLIFGVLLLYSQGANRIVGRKVL